MNQLRPIPLVLIAGALAALCTSVLIWILDYTAVNAVLAMPIIAGDDLVRWAGGRVLEGALYALLFLVPVLRDWNQRKRGMVVGAVSVLSFWFVRWPQQGLGILGLELGPLLPVWGAVLWVLWGYIAGWLLERLGHGSAVS